MAKNTTRALRRARELAGTAARNDQEEIRKAAEKAAASYADALAAAAAKQDSDAPRYGATAEALAGDELTGSGYAAFLAGRQKQNYRAASTTATAAYEASLEEGEAKLRQSALDRILEKNATRFSEAYGIAEEFGLHGEAAATVARTGAGLAARPATPAASTLTVILNRLVTGRMTGEDAVQYALACGLSREEAERLAAAAKVAYDSQANIFREYLDRTAGTTPR